MEQAICDKGKAIMTGETIRKWDGKILSNPK